ncbi:hypothetical protein SKAU_G00276080 [Synaphobranchus kaupii]|uniref:Uncharacterized protein n=1 Tax=Synaphobranchus kaupii TaxID=118154 RepID=A0A9Q1IR27_SYNKA|nr:hypothetical protein SKAU_G00276080 [Synaphobranchus kaupii]
MDASSSVNDRFSGRCDSVNESHRRQLKSWLPPGYEYHVCSFEERPTDLVLDHRGFEASFRMAITGVGQLKDWVQKLAHSSGVTWRVAVTKLSKAQRVLFKVRSQTAKDRRFSKNTCCAAKMVCTLVTTVDKRGGLSRSKDPHVPTYPASVRVYNVHNHNISVAEALRHRDVGAKAIETLTQLFEIGHNPTSALPVLKSDLLVEHGDKYVYVSANRALCPDLHFCYRQTHGLKHSGELCFIDSSGNMDREDCRVFLLLTHTCAGGRPLWIVMMSNGDHVTDTEENYDDAVTLDWIQVGENILAPKSPPAPSGMDYDDVGEEPLERGGAF